MICDDIWHKYHKWYFKIVIIIVVALAPYIASLRPGE